MESLEFKKEALSFEDFTSLDKETGTPHYNNFFVHFLPDEFLGKMYRDKAAYELFARNYPDVAIDMARKVGSIDLSQGTQVALKPLERDLYNAYLLMRQYVSRDSELFK